MAQASAHAHGHGHGDDHHDGAAAVHTEPHQEHPIRTYMVVWIWLFVLSACSYAVDYFHVQGYPRWTLILIFMMLKAGLIVAVFMHMAWERLAMMYAILLPPAFVLVFTLMMVFESDYTLWMRQTFFGGEAPVAATAPPAH
jgi:cytochrome c oxidase subunit IV